MPKKNTNKTQQFAPVYTITPEIALALMRIEAAKQAVAHLPITPTVLKKLRETSRLQSIHYSTAIEGNRLTLEEATKVIQRSAHFRGRERDELEVKGYFAALAEVERLVARGLPISEKVIQTLHGLVMSGGKSKTKPSHYRDGQNVIKDSETAKIVYMPPEADDVPQLMEALVKWINSESALPCPLKAGIVHYQFATIHPYYDGNGRTARLLATLIMHQGGYDLRGIYSLDEYYAKHLSSYYDSLAVGPSHNYYLGRAQSDITSWLTYFCSGAAHAFESVHKQATEAASQKTADASSDMRNLDARQRQALELFVTDEIVTAKQIGSLFGFQPRTCSQLCQKWEQQGFLVIVNTSKKGRTYRLAKQLRSIIK